MKYWVRPPSPDLTNFIKCFWALEYGLSEKTAGPESVLPDGCPEIVFNLSDRFYRQHHQYEELQPATILAGQLGRSIFIRPSGNVRLFGVRLQPAGAPPLVRFPIHELTDQIIDLTAACGRPGRDLEDQICSAISFADRVAIFERFLQTRLAGGAKTDAISTTASRLIVVGKGRLTVSNIADRLGVSERQLERRFKRSIGISPKLFSRIVRFQAVITAVQQSAAPDLLDTALAFGYYDQSHLIRDFNQFYGGSPTEFFERTHQISDVFTGAI